MGKTLLCGNQTSFKKYLFEMGAAVAQLLASGH